MHGGQPVATRRCDRTCSRSRQKSSPGLTTQRASAMIHRDVHHGDRSLLCRTSHLGCSNCVDTPDGQKPPSEMRFSCEDRMQTTFGRISFHTGDTCHGAVRYAIQDSRSFFGRQHQWDIREGSAWDNVVSGKTVLTWSEPTSFSFYSAYSSTTLTGVATVTPEEDTNIRAALNSWAAVANLAFNSITSIHDTRGSPLCAGNYKSRQQPRLLWSLFGSWPDGRTRESDLPGDTFFDTINNRSRSAATEYGARFLG